MSRRSNRFDDNIINYIECVSPLFPSSISCMYNNDFIKDGDGKIFYCFGYKGGDKEVLIHQLKGDDLDFNKLIFRDQYISNRLMYSYCEEELYFCEDREL